MSKHFLLELLVYRQEKIKIQTQGELNFTTLESVMKTIELPLLLEEINIKLRPTSTPFPFQDWTLRKHLFIRTLNFGSQIREQTMLFSNSTLKALMIR